MTHNNIILIMCNSAYNHDNSIIYDRNFLNTLKNERNLKFGRSAIEKDD